jgi:hypothetical protein
MKKCIDKTIELCYYQTIIRDFVLIIIYSNDIVVNVAYRKARTTAYIVVRAFSVLDYLLAAGALELACYGVGIKLMV